MLKGDDTSFDLAFDTLLRCIDIVGKNALIYDELKQTIGKDFMFYLQINLRKLKDDPEDDSCNHKSNKQ